MLYRWITLSPTQVVFSAHIKNFLQLFRFSFSWLACFLHCRFKNAQKQRHFYKNPMQLGPYTEVPSDDKTF
jgi:hypothetical protein